MNKLLKWIPANIVGLLGIVQAVLKCIKEILTVIIDVLLPVIPGDKFDKVIKLVRDIVNKADGFVQKIKDFFLKTVN
jgi:phage-related protein